MTLKKKRDWTAAARTRRRVRSVYGSEEQVAWGSEGRIAREKTGAGRSVRVCFVCWKKDCFVEAQQGSGCYERTFFCKAMAQICKRSCFFFFTQFARSNIVPPRQRRDRREKCDFALIWWVFSTFGPQSDHSNTLKSADNNYVLRRFTSIWILGALFSSWLQLLSRLVVLQNPALSATADNGGHLPQVACLPPPPLPVGASKHTTVLPTELQKSSCGALLRSWLKWHALRLTIVTPHSSPSTFAFTTWTYHLPLERHVTTYTNSKKRHLFLNYPLPVALRCDRVYIPSPPVSALNARLHSYTFSFAPTATLSQHW